jgi:hypothetical protein
LHHQNSAKIGHHLDALRVGWREIKRDSLVHQTFSPDFAAVSMHDTLHARQAYAGAFKHFQRRAVGTRRNAYSHIAHQIHSLVANEHHDLILLWAHASRLDFGL